MENNNPVINRVSYFNDLISLCRVIKNTATSEDFIDCSSIESSIDKIQKTLNNIFPTKECNEVIFNTENYGKIPFGIMVNPNISCEQLGMLLLNDNINNDILERYSVEIDSNIFNILAAEEVAAYIVEEVYGIVSPDTVTLVMALIDKSICRTGIDIRCRDIVYDDKFPIILYGIKDVIQKTGSLLNKNSELIGANVFAKAFDTETEIKNVVDKIKSVYGIMINNDSIDRTSLFIRLIDFCSDFETNFNMIRDAMIKAKSFSVSILQKRDIDFVLKYIDSCVDESAINENYNIMLESIPFFSKLKRKGLKQIEDDLYEFQIRVKNCEVQEDALYILRQINSRIAILDDYAMSSDISDYERDKYIDLVMKFRKLREEIGKKNVKYKKSYGIFVDYDKLDAMDM